MHSYEYHFEAKVELHDFGRMAYTVVYLPARLKAALPFDQYPRLRIEGEVNGVRINGAFQPAAGGKSYLMLSKRFLRSCQLSVGDRVRVEFDIADQDAVDIPSELRFALDANDEAARIWGQISSGRRRGLAYRVSSAKREGTRENRVEEVLQTLREIGHRAK